MNEPIYKGLLQSDLDCAGFDLLNFSGGGGSGLPDGGTTGQLLQKQSSADGDADWATVASGGGVARKFDVKTYGAIGDGTTDDTTAIRNALAAIPAGGGVLYFPAGIYKYAGATLTLTGLITVEGDGGQRNLPPDYSVSTIVFNSLTVSLFTVTGGGCAFRNIGMLNTNASLPVSGAGITVAGDGTAYGGSNIWFENVTVIGFYIGIDVRAGSIHRFEGCLIAGGVLYELKLANIAAPDGGDHMISDCWFYGGRPGTTPVAAIRIESGGGPKFVNCKINGGGGAGMFTSGIDLMVNGVVTSDLLVSNCSIEGFSAYGIKGTTTGGGQWRNSIITGNQFQAFGSANARAIYLVGTNPGDFNGWTITGNWAENYGTASSNPVIYLANCSNFIVTANGGNNYGGASWPMLGLGSGVTFADSPTYIGRDARLVSISGGVKLEVRNTGTDTWVEATRYTNP